MATLFQTILSVLVPSETKGCEMKKGICVLVAALCSVFVAIAMIAKRKKGDSQYKNEPEQRNLVEGKKVIFVENEAEPENADGARGHLEVIGAANSQLGFYNTYMKRGLDILLSFLGLVLLSPVFAGIAMVIKMEDPGPVFFIQKRIGQSKKYFKLHKFRTMKMCTPHDVPTHRLDNPEQYITHIGKFLREHSLDELPQLWDIFIGNMSVIGPRPALWNQDVLTAERDKYGANDVKPGLTGWAQINGRDELRIPDKAKLDGDYVKNIGFWMDVKCFLGSVGVFIRDDTVVEGNSQDKEKVLYDSSTEIVSSIKGKKILFFAPLFFEYEKKIAKKMEKMGAIVDMYNVRSVTSAKDRALLKISARLFHSKSLAYYEKIIRENKGKEYDYILVIKCDMTPERILAKFRKEFPKAKMCLYLWDSVKNIPGILGKFQYFDTLHSFDMEDCKKYRELKFRPLFYADEFCKEAKTDVQKYEVSFAGTVHSDRFAVIKQVRERTEKKGDSVWYCYLQSKFIYYFYKVTKREFANTKITDFDFKKLESKDIVEIVRQSKAVLDIQHPKQTGLTMRTIEMLGMNKKLITTNAAILNYDFYNPNNIKVVDRKNVVIDEMFLDTKYEPLSEEIYNKYSLHSWILEVLS